MEEDPKSQRISGSGKSYIAIGLGLAAREKGLSVGFITAASLVHELIEARRQVSLASAAPTGRATSCQIASNKDRHFASNRGSDAVLVIGTSCRADQSGP